jgi:hypothetical protein
MSHVSSPSCVTGRKQVLRLRSLRPRSPCGTGACKVASSGFGRKLAQRLSAENHRSSIVRKVFRWEVVLYAPHDRYAGVNIAAGVANMELRPAATAPARRRAQ